MLIFTSVFIQNLRPQAEALLPRGAQRPGGPLAHTNVPPKFHSDIPVEVVGTIELSNGDDLFFFFVILVSNLVFFFYWIYKLLSEVRVMILKKYEKIYVCLFLCFNRSQLDKQKAQMMQEEENELLRKNYIKTVRKLKVLYDPGRLVLT